MSAAFDAMAVAVRHHQAGNLDQAIACYRRALELDPQLAEAHFNLGIALRALGKIDEAIACYLRAIALRPDYAEAHNNLGNALKDRGNLDEAVGCYRRAIEAAPSYAVAHNNLGAALQALGKLDEAIVGYRRAIELQPDLAAAHTNLGTALRDQGESDYAVACHRRALELRPDYAEAYNHLGTALKDQALLDEAIASFRRAIELKPDFVAAYSNLLYTLWFSPACDAAAIFEEHCRFDQQYGKPLARFVQPHANDRSGNRRLRIGYVSPDFCDHCQALFTTPLLSAHDHEQFEIFCYADVLRPDAVTQRLQGLADAWRNIVGLPPSEVANIIRRDQIDILVDLTMHMKRGHLLVFACKPAPIQVCWLAYPGTTGLSAIDYRLTDPYLDPLPLGEAGTAAKRWSSPKANRVRVYSEETFHLPDTFWCYDPLTTEPAVSQLPALKNGHITFGSLNNFCKINARVLKLWARVLKSVDRSRLILLADHGSHRQHTLDILAQEGIDPDRITFFSRQPRGKYLELYHQIDIGLDTLPYNGHTTSLDAYWMGVPVITLVGQTVVGRAGLSQLTNLGLPDFIAHTPDDYIRIAADLAADLSRLSDLRSTLRSRMQRSPLMDANRFTRHLEAAYRAMWQRWCANS